jgi:hypothetical protein
MGQIQSGAPVIYLTDYAKGIGFNAVNLAARILAPEVVVNSPVGKFKKFDDKNAFQAPDTSRALGGGARRLEFNGTDGDFNCAPQALEIGIDDAERADEASARTTQEQAKVRTVINSAIRAHGKKVFDKAAAGLAAAATPAWSTASSGNPISDLNAQIEAIATETGEFPTHIVLGVTAWRYFVQHDKVADKFKGGVVTPSVIMAASLLLAPNIQFVVDPLVIDTAKPGATKSNSQVYGSNIFLMISSPSPTMYDPSFMKTFRTREGGVEQVRMYRDDKARSDIYAIDWSEDIQVTSTAGARRLTVT